MSLPKEAIDAAAEVIEEMESRYNERIIARAALGVTYPILYEAILTEVITAIRELRP